jgi:hypothetical protein
MERDYTLNTKPRWEYNIKMDVTEIRYGVGVDSFRYYQGSLESSCEQGNKPSGSIKNRKFLWGMR